MDDYYHRFSELFFAGLSADEIEWSKRMLSLDGPEAEKLLPGVDVEYGWPGFACTVYRDNRDGTDALWIRSEGSFCPENVAAFLRGFLGKFRPNEVVTFTWAGICSEPTAGEFGGGWAVVSAGGVVFGDTWEAAKAALARMKPTASMKHKTEYLASGGSGCPYCNSPEVSAGSLTIDRGGAEQKITCETCGKTWFDVYRLVDVEEAAL